MVVRRRQCTPIGIISAEVDIFHPEVNVSISLKVDSPTTSRTQLRGVSNGKKAMQTMEIVGTIYLHTHTTHGL